MTITLDTLTLPADLQWINEFDWHPVAQNFDRSVSGVPLIQEAPLSYGRPIILQGGPRGSWITRADLKAIHAKADTPSQTMALDFHGEQHAVMFDRRQGQPVTATELFRLADPPPDHWYHNLTIRLLTVEPA